MTCGSASKVSFPRTPCRGRRRLRSGSTKITALNPKDPPRLKRITISINRHGVLSSTGLPACRLEDIQPATTVDALAVCRRSLVGEGTFSAKVLLKGQAPFPSEGKLYAFNGEVEGRPAILAHVYGTRPAPTSFTLIFLISRSKGTFGTTLGASLPRINAGSGYITGLSLSLGRTSSAGRGPSYISASCPAPKGFHGASFPFARATFAFAGQSKVSSTLTRSCGVR
jgi:hypothetical protein